MTREEAIQKLEHYRYCLNYQYGWFGEEDNEAIDMAISALTEENRNEYVRIEVYRDLYEKYQELKHTISREEALEQIVKCDECVLNEYCLNKVVLYEPINARKYDSGTITYCSLGIKGADVPIKETNTADSLLTDSADDANESERKLEPSDLISRADALREMAQAECGVNYEHCCEEDCACSYIQRILDIPSVSAERVGVWIKKDVYHLDSVFEIECNQCGSGMWQSRNEEKYPNYCYNCGARMENTK